MNAAENQIVVYQPNETVRLDVRLENETVWLTQAKLGVLFGVDRTVVNRHIHNIYKTGELEETATCAKIAQVQNEGGRSITRIVPFYNLDMIIAVGYRVNSLQATRFRQWATKVLHDYLLRGYSFNARMNQLEDKMDRRLAQHDQAIVDLKEKVDFFVQTKEPPLQSIFYQNKFWDAKSLLIKFILGCSRAEYGKQVVKGLASRLMLFHGSGWDEKTLRHCLRAAETFGEEEIVSAARRQLSWTHIKTHYNGICHDRFIIVDQKEIFWKMRRRNAHAFRRGDSAKAEPEGRTSVRGASLKDAGRLTFAAAKMGGEIIPVLLDSIRKATSESVAYPTDKSAASRSRHLG